MTTTLPDTLDYVRVEFQATKLASEAICARAVSHYDDSDMDVQARHEAAIEALTSIATLFGLELRVPAEHSDADRAATISDAANRDGEPRVTLADAVNVWKGYAECALNSGMTFSDAQAAFKAPFPLHHKLVFGKACDAPALALAGE